MAIWCRFCCDRITARPNAGGAFWALQAFGRAVIIPLQNQQDLAVLAERVAQSQTKGLGVRLTHRQTWVEAAQKAAHAAREAAQRQIAAPLPTQRVAM